MQLRELTDRYQLHQILKSARFGTVMRATEVPSGRAVVIKLITVGSSPGLAAAPDFEKLAGVLAGAGHPNLPALLDSGFTTDGSAFLVFEPLEGRGLDSFSGMPPARALPLMGQVLNGIGALARAGLAHHNLSPDNVFLVQTPGGGVQVKLLGLGTAIFWPRGPENDRFRAPELAAGGPADWRADLFSLALLTSHVLGATVGFGEAPVVQLPLSVAFELEGDEPLRQALERSLRRNPGERPAPQQFYEALRRAVGGAAPAPAPAVTATPPPQPVAAPPPSPAAPPPAAVEPPAPEPVPEAPEEDGELLSAVDDEVLNALLSVPPPPPRPLAEPAAEAQGKVVPFQKPQRTAASPPAGRSTATPAPGGGGSLLRRPALLGALAGLFVLLVLTAVWFLRRPQPVAASVPPPAAAALPKPPSEPPVARLEEAKLHLGQGEDREARRVLRSIPFGEQGLLSAQGCRELAVLEETLALTGLEHLASDLANGLKTGDLESLQAAVEAGAGQEAGLDPEVRAGLDRARGAVDAYAQARAAAGRGEHVEVLERFAALAALLPKANDPEDLRGKAAHALESEADARVAEGKYAEALAKLGPIQQTWPDRPGLAERIARYASWQRGEKEQETLLAALPGIERRKKPTEGLEALQGVEPTPHLAPRFAEARARLENLLVRLDQQPPKLVLRDGYLLDYARGTVAELSFRATDDYEIKDVKVLARPQGGKFRELPLEKDRAGYYTIQIAPGFHQNGTVDLYAVAIDSSGHETYLGSRDKPLQLKRKQGFDALIR